MRKSFKIFVLFFLFSLLFSCSNLFKKYEFLKEPRITNIPDQNMLVVKMQGNPATTSKLAIGMLYKTYFGLKKQHNELKFMVTPKARWTMPLETPVDQWIGLFGLPIPNSIDKLPTTGFEINIENWKYGDVVEILHVGSYKSEEATIKKLNQFISDKGYKIAGPHEEEYIKGPGMFFKGNPDKYLTIIRYSVEKIENKK